MSKELALLIGVRARALAMAVNDKRSNLTLVLGTLFFAFKLAALDVRNQRSASFCPITAYKHFPYLLLLK